MPHNQKAAFTVLAIAAILALGFGFWQIRSNIRTPFLLKPLKARQATDDTWIDMQNKDTDKDGLSDYDETYLHATSPYLEDSDSDGKLDGDEIKDGTDPNCPEGKDCKAVASKSTTSASLDTPSAQAGNTQSAENIDLTSLSLDDIREILKASGIDEESLDKLDDKAIKEIYDEALKATE